MAKLKKYALVSLGVSAVAAAYVALVYAGVIRDMGQAVTDAFDDLQL